MKLVAGLIGAMAAALGMAAPASAEWREYSTRHFIIYSDSGDEVAGELATELEKIDGLMRMATGLPTDVEPMPVRIFQVRDTSTIEHVLGEANSGVAGFYDTNVLGPYAVTPRRTDAGDSKFTPGLVLRHEYAHHFMRQYFPATYPTWYSEGFAELIGSSEIMRDGRVAYGLPAEHRGDSISRHWVPMQEVLLTPPEKLKNFDTYGQGWAMTHFLTFSKERSPQLRRYLSALTAGQTPEQAARAFGNLRDLSREASIYLSNGRFEYRPVKVPIREPVIERVRTLSAGEAALILETMAFRDDDLRFYRKESAREKEQRLRARNLEQVREKAARFPNDPFAQYLLSEVEFAAGNLPASNAAADRALALNPRHARAMARKSLALSYLAAKLPAASRVQQVEQARELALSANRADPNQLLPLRAYYESYRAVGEAPAKAALEALEMVVATQPQDSAARQMLVDEYESRRRWSDAIRTLTPIASGLHDSPRRESARAQMERLEAALAAELGAQPRAQ